MTPRIKWIIEDFHSDNGLGPLIDAVRKSGQIVDPITYVPFRGGTYSQWSDNEKILFIGSINLAQQLWDERPAWRRGIWSNFPNYNCTVYLPQIGEYCLNGDHLLIPFNEIWDRRWELMPFTRDACVFIRPNAGVKEFTGAVVDMLHLESQLKSWESNTTKDSIAVISSPKKIKAEWRNVVVNYGGHREVVASSLSVLDGNKTCVPGAPKKVIELAEHVLGILVPPDPMFAIDVAQLSDDTYRVVEMNAFSSCGLYSCPKDPIVKVATEVATDLWSK